MSPDLKKILIVVLVIAGLLGLKVLTREGRSGTARRAMYKRYARLADEKRVKEVVDRHHESCFKGSYDPGSGRRWSKLNAQQYAKCMDSVIVPALR